jgi:hypothetical protein
MPRKARAAGAIHSHFVGRNIIIRWRIYLCFSAYNRCGVASGNLCPGGYNPGYTHSYLECWVLELPLDDLRPSMLLAWERSALLCRLSGSGHLQWTSAITKATTPTARRCTIPIRPRIGLPPPRKRLRRRQNGPNLTRPCRESLPLTVRPCRTVRRSPERPAQCPMCARDRRP